MSTTATAEPEVAAALDPQSTSLEKLEPQLIESPPISGHLAIKPNQKSLTAEQQAAFAAIVNFPVAKGDPWVENNWELIAANINVFMHVCQSRGLDPWAKQIYLVRRGSDSNPTFTIQTGIDGYRYMAERTRRTLGAATVFWSGAEDDIANWREAIDPGTGITVMEPRWWGAWPKRFGNPGMARAVQRYRTLSGEEASADVVGHWGMFAPYFPETEGWGKNKKAKLDEHGNKIMKLADMWERDGGAHMLAKCSEAAVIRKAFPQAVAGIFVNEELHKADAEATAQVEEERHARIMEARAAAQETAQDRESVTLVKPGTISGRVEPDGEDEAPDADAPEPPTQEQLRRWLKDELSEMTQIRGGKPKDAFNFVASRLGAPIDQAHPDDILAIVGPLRQVTVTSMRKMAELAETAADKAAESGEYDTAATHRATAARWTSEADAYERAGSTVVAPVEELLGRAVPGGEQDEEDDRDAPQDDTTAEEGASAPQEPCQDGAAPEGHAGPVDAAELE